MQNNWKETTLGEVAEIKGGKRLPKGQQLQCIKTFHPYIRITDIVNNQIQTHTLQYVPDAVFPSIKRYIVSEGDIILSIVGTIGSVARINKKLHNASLTENCVKLTNFQSIERDFLFYYLISKEGQAEIQSRNVGSTQPKLPIYNIEKIQILCPPLPEQKAIAAILSSFDDKIELLMRQNKTLEAIAQTTFKEWFVNFTVNGKKLKVNSKTGLPDGWRMGRLGDEFQIVMGQSPDGESYNESGDGMIFFQGRAEFQERFPATRLYTTEPKRIAEKFDVLVSVRAPVGDINVASAKCCIGRGLAAVRGKYKSYALYKIKSLKDAFNKFEAEGTVFGSIGKDSFADIEAIIPDSETIKSFEMITSPIDAKIYNNNSQIQTLSKLRDTLLPKLMKGKIRVKDSEKLREKAL